MKWDGYDEKLRLFLERIDPKGNTPVIDVETLFTRLYKEGLPFVGFWEEKDFDNAERMLGLW